MKLHQKYFIAILNKLYLMLQKKFLLMQILNIIYGILKEKKKINIIKTSLKKLFWIIKYNKNKFRKIILNY